MKEAQEEGGSQVCAARLDLECLDLGRVYPSWDAANLHLAETWVSFDGSYMLLKRFLFVARQKNGIFGKTEED